jgi:formylglycine-generating enzyme required for sulfatase activity
MPEPKRPLKVFLSYASQDKPVVRELSDRLAREGWIDPWVDEKKLLPGQDWRTKIEEAVETSDIVIICLSSNSVTKEGFVQKELRYAREIALEKPDETIFLIPLRLDNCETPRGLRFYQWVDYFGDKKDDSYSSLIESLKLRYEQKFKLEAAERAQKEKQEREIAEMIAREKEEREAAEKIAQERVSREKAEQEAAERARLEAEEKARQKAAKEKAQREAVNRIAKEKVAREKAERDAAEKTAKEKAEHGAAEKAGIEQKEHEKKTLPKVQLTPKEKTALKKSKLPRKLNGVIVITLIGLVGIICAVTISSPLWIKVFTPQSVPTLAPTFTPASPTKTPKSSITVTKTRTPIVQPTAIVFNPHSDPSDYIDDFGVPMRLVPAGEFTMGTNDVLESDTGKEKPVHTVYLDSYYIDKFEVTNFAYKSCVDAGVCIPPIDSSTDIQASYYGDSKFKDYPVVFITWYMAKTYCEWRGARTPTEAQWEKAARGDDSRKYPWGNDEADCGKANYQPCVGNATKVGSYLSGKSPYGVYDMAGNVFEWTADWFSKTYYDASPRSNPLGPETGDARVIRGGSWTGDIDYRVRADIRLWFDPNNAWRSIGFRCSKYANP